MKIQKKLNKKLLKMKNEMKIIWSKKKLKFKNKMKIQQNNHIKNK